MLASLSRTGVLLRQIGYSRRGIRITPRCMALDKVTFGDGIPGYVSGDKSSPAVIVLQEWWGVTDEIKSQAEHLKAAGGYRVLVPDLYKGKVGVDAEEASHLMGNLDFKQAVDEIKAAASYLKGEGAPKVGVIGFCMGGALTFLAGEYADVDALAPFYGTPSGELAHPERIKVPVQAHCAQEDAHKGFADPQTMQGVIDKIKGAGGNAELFVYPGEGHGFMNAGEDILKKMSTGKMPVGKPESQKLAWSRVFAFFAEHLGGKPAPS